jgi:cyclopropane-fatty-acyl-phospholipid synthase
MLAPHFSRALLGRLREGRVRLVDGRGSRAFGPPGAALEATVRLHDKGFLDAMPHGSLALADAYAEGRWDSDDLVSLVRIGARELPRLDGLRRLFAPLRNAVTRIPRNTRDGARRHVSAHYDLGNEMFRLFLDETMTYSCAYFESPDATLREAQEAKLDRICRKLELGPDDHVVEIGTGWGSFAMHAAGRYGCRVTTTTISREQHALALERVREAGLQDQVSVVLEDYRDLSWSFD